MVVFGLIKVGEDRDRDDVEDTGEVDKLGDEEFEFELAFESLFFELLTSLGEADLNRLERLKNDPFPNMSPAFGCRAQ